MKSKKGRSKKAASARSSRKDLTPRGQSVKGGTASVVTNLANMRHEALKAVANNLRG